ncbi:MAG: hypothetical protein PHE99_04210, partial [Bacteroidales bacterium]|nr:hypothetical protein [Bacteroidales bacterium]
ARRFFDAQFYRCKLLAGLNMPLKPNRENATMILKILDANGFNAVLLSGIYDENECGAATMKNGFVNFSMGKRFESYFPGDPSIIQYAGFTKMSPITIRNQSIGYLQKDSATYNTTMETHSIHGAAMMVKKEVINKIGLMPQIYFLYYEEHDWAVKAKREGYKLYYCAQSHILHKESLSTGKDSPLKTYYLNRGRLIYTIRNSKRRDLLLSLLFQFFISLPKNSTIFIIKREFQNLKAYWRAYFWVIKNFKQLSV